MVAQTFALQGRFTGEGRMAGDRMRRTLSALAAGVVALGLMAAAPAEPCRLTIDAAAPTTARDRMARFSVGSDFAGTLIRDDVLAQLRVAQDELGFRYIRFHDIFHDALGTYRVVDGAPVYDWDRIDHLYDALLGMGIRPFIELGFTPDAMKTSDQTIFYWKGNTSHPEPEAWDALIDAFVRHLVDRYGVEEVRTWYFEFWNEPNLDGFWEGADQDAYFAYYGRTARVIKAIDPALRVGGPSTAGAAWVPEFLAYADAHRLPVDFITTHTYGVDGGFLDEKGENDNRLSPSPESVIGDVRRVRAQIEASSRPGLPLFITEWSTSYNPRDPVHDDYLSPSWILTRLRGVEGQVQGMSYWAHSDLFEEPGPQTLPFQGGFGLMNPDGLRKPAWFAYRYLAALGDQETPTGDDQSIATVDDGAVRVLAWRYVAPDQPVSNRPYFTRIRPPAEAAPLAVSVSGLAAGTWEVRLRRTGFEANDAYTAWLQMDRPGTLSPDQLERLQALTSDAPAVGTVVVGADGRAEISAPMRDYDVVLVELVRAGA
jgi:xylan 1,4-beta-xylosidase